ncbi:MAG: hypothetical protein J6K21_01690 [Bacilli bacterium]|nr:hypothetical protein [Bacilli bacterium]
MKEINELIRKYELKPNGYIKKGKALVVKTKDKNIIIKKKQDENEIYKYLNSRSFRYYPKIISEDGNYRITEYIDDIEMPKEQKMLDMIDLVSLLHYKTTYYKEVDEDDYKKIYEDVMGNIEYLNSYYLDLITIIESKVYMSPSEFLLAFNISKIFASLNYCQAKIKEWLSIIDEKKKQRFVVLHNNLEIDHYIRNNEPYLISWDKAKIDIPIFDLYKLYKRYSLDYDFEPILKKYEMNYPLLEEEKILFFVLITLPDKIEFNKSEYENTKIVGKQIDNLYKTEKLIEEYSKTKKEYISS